MYKKTTLLLYVFTILTHLMPNFATDEKKDENPEIEQTNTMSLSLLSNPSITIHHPNSLELIEEGEELILNSSPDTSLVDSEAQKLEKKLLNLFLQKKDTNKKTISLQKRRSISQGINNLNNTSGIPFISRQNSTLDEEGEVTKLILQFLSYTPTEENKKLIKDNLGICFDFAMRILLDSKDVKRMSKDKGDKSYSKKTLTIVQQWFFDQIPTWFDDNDIILPEHHDKIYKILLYLQELLEHPLLTKKEVQDLKKNHKENVHTILVKCPYIKIGLELQKEGVSTSLAEFQELIEIKRFSPAAAIASDTSYIKSIAQKTLIYALSLFTKESYSVHLQTDTAKVIALFFKSETILRALSEFYQQTASTLPKALQHTISYIAKDHRQFRYMMAQPDMLDLGAKPYIELFDIFNNLFKSYDHVLSQTYVTTVAYQKISSIVDKKAGLLQPKMGLWDTKINFADWGFPLPALFQIYYSGSSQFFTLFIQDMHRLAIDRYRSENNQQITEEEINEQANKLAHYNVTRLLEKRGSNEFFSVDIEEQLTRGTPFTETLHTNQYTNSTFRSCSNLLYHQIKHGKVCQCKCQLRCCLKKEDITYSSCCNCFQCKCAKIWCNLSCKKYCIYSCKNPFLTWCGNCTNCKDVFEQTYKKGFKKTYWVCCTKQFIKKIHWLLWKGWCCLNTSCVKNSSSQIATKCFRCNKEGNCYQCSHFWCECKGQTLLSPCLTCCIVVSNPDYGLRTQHATTAYVNFLCNESGDPEEIGSPIIRSMVYPFQELHKPSKDDEVKQLLNIMRLKLKSSHPSTPTISLQRENSKLYMDPITFRTYEVVDLEVKGDNLLPKHSKVKAMKINSVSSGLNLSSEEVDLEVKPQINQRFEKLDKSIELDLAVNNNSQQEHNSTTSDSDCSCSWLIYLIYCICPILFICND